MTSRLRNTLLLAVLALGLVALGVVVTGRGGAGSQGDTAAPPADLAAALGSFYMPGEFEPQEFLLVGGGTLAVEAPDVLRELVRLAAPEVRLLILASDAADRAPIEAMLTGPDLPADRCGFLPAQAKGLWLRDFGPLTVSDAAGLRSMVDFVAIAPGVDRSDDGLPALVAESLGLAVLGNRARLAGGDLLNNGRGLGLLSARVLERNAAEPGFAPRETLQNVASLLGLENVVALHPPADEPTGHLSVVACFLAPDLIVVGRDGARADAATADHLDGLARELAGAPTLVGPLRVARIPQPDHRDGVWRSYTEIVFANGVVLVPVYPDHCPDLDAEALAVYRRLLPDRRIEPIDASALARRGGGLHRVTVNVPASRGLGDGP